MENKMYVENYIKIEDLVLGAKYKGIGRNFDEAVWKGDGFYGQRFKFGKTFEDRELHYDADDHYGTFQPLEMLT